MTEEAIFAGALEKSTSAERDAYLNSVCSGDAALRRRVEALLKSHEDAAGFLGTPAVQIAAEALAGQGHSADTQPEPPGGSDTIRLDFLTPSEDPQALGRIKEYTVTEVIGRGGMGIVLKARDASLDRVVAIKVLAPELASNVTARKRFLREAKTAAAVTHQHVVTIHAVGEDRLPYLVMECVSGQSLQDKLDQQGPLELREVLRIGTQVAAGLAAAHAHGVIHRDIKPANILLENGIERVRITDFGLARAVDDVAMTRTGEVAGTPQYMSPEQAQGQPVDARSDLFSFGSVLYAMCTGRPPFRSETSIDAIRRVCDDTPRPIREINGEVPEWLTGIIDRLLAKRPEDRFQTAQEVSQLLGKHLAHVQDPGSTPFPMLSPPSRHTGEVPEVRKRASRRWVAAAVVLCAVLAGLGVTEGTGVTQLAKTVVNIVTNEGTLVIEVDDPTVQVSLDGEVLTISGGGVEQVKLRPGQYQFTAMKNGRPVKQELVTITRGDKRVVTVSREAVQQATAAPLASAERGAFVVLGGERVAERNFDTLAEAVLGASDGDTIEVRGNGPFVTQPISLGPTGLTIRAATGFRPMILGIANPAADGGSYLLYARGPLVLEGLELRMTASVESRVVRSEQAPLHVANCRLVLDGSGFPIQAHSPLLTVRNCEFVRAANSDCEHVLAFLFDKLAIVLDNNVFADPFPTGRALGLVWESAELHNVTVRLNHNTMVTGTSLVHGFRVVPESAVPRAGPDGHPVRIHVSATLFDPIDPGGTCSLILPPDWFQNDAKPLSAEEVERLLPRLVAWREERNLYRKGMILQRMPRITDRSKPDRGEVMDVLPAGRALADWQRLWQAGDSGSAEGVIRYEGGNVLSKLKATPELVTAADFRLRPDSAGYQAGPDGKDLGADVDLVGPGAAYERWKKTPEYQEWLKETAQAEQPE